MVNRSQIGKGSFEVRQANQPKPSAWVYSEGADGDETWIWITGIRPGGDANRILTTPLNPANAIWRFVAMPGAPFADVDAFRARVIQDAPEQNYVLIGFTHGKVILGGLQGP